MATTATAPAGRRFLVLGVLILAYTFNYIDRQILGILAGAIKRDLHLTDSQLGLMGGLAFALFYTALGIPIAWLADRWSRSWRCGAPSPPPAARPAASGACSSAAWASASARRAALRRPIR
jgi:MFS family permease